MVLADLILERQKHHPDQVKLQSCYPLVKKMKPKNHSRIVFFLVFEVSYAFPKLLESTAADQAWKVGKVYVEMLHHLVVFFLFWKMHGQRVFSRV